MRLLKNLVAFFLFACTEHRCGYSRKLSISFYQSRKGVLFVLSALETYFILFDCMTYVGKGMLGDFQILKSLITA